MTTDPATIETRLMIGGQWTPARDGRTYPVFNPARPKQQVGSAARASVVDVDAAVEAAHEAFPTWAGLSFQERARLLKQVAARLVADEAELEQRIRLFTREHGKILSESRLEMTRLGDRFVSAADMAERLAEEERLPGPPFDTVIFKQPRGVAALITPWNWPLSILGGKLPQALIAGNTVVIKLANLSPLAPSLTIRLIADTLPPGVVNLVTGKASEIGDALVAHPLVRKINFTGGTDTGRHIMRIAAANLKHLTLELGGNDAGIVLDDADLDQAAVRRMVVGCFLTAGQVCMALKRIYVDRSRYGELVEKFKKVAGEHVVGDGLDPEVTMGPLNNSSQLKTVRQLVADAEARGAVVDRVGKAKDQEVFEQGYFHLPTVVTEAEPDLDVVRFEQFGPVIPILAVDSEEEAIERANDSEFGLCSSVWTRDRQRAVRVAKQLEAGYTYVNAHGPMIQDNRAPFGGFKESGLGRNLGYEGILEFLEPHSISSTPGWLFQ